ncbi:MAG: DsrE family protein [Bacteroidales bacterium]
MRTTVVFNSFGMGDADNKLSHLLAKNFLTLTLDEKELPKYICFYAEGIKLTLNDSPVLEEIKKLEEKGVIILICKTCSIHYGVLERVSCGTVATMLDIMGAMNNTDKVITL